MFVRGILLLEAAWEALILGLFSQPFLGASAFTLYSPSWLILALHLLIRQVPTSVPVPSAVPPCFLLVAMIEVNLSMRLFSLTWLGRWQVYLMRRGRIYPEPVSHRVGPILIVSPSGGFLGAALNEMLLFPLKSWSAEDRAILGCAPNISAFPYSSSANTLLDTGPAP